LLGCGKRKTTALLYLPKVGGGEGGKDSEEDYLLSKLAGKKDREKKNRQTRKRDKNLWLEILVR